MTVFVTRGMTLAIPAGGLTLNVGPDGGLNADLVLHVRYDVCQTWVGIAHRHLEEARSRQAEREQAWSGTDDPRKAATLEREFEASMQAITAAAIALDALYAMVQPHVKVPPSLIKRWRTGRTSRYSQVAEVLRRAFLLKPMGVAALRQNLKEIYRFRDLAVHPSGKFEAPILHPDLKVGVEWRFVYFRASNAELAVNKATEMLRELTSVARFHNSEIQRYATELRRRLDEVLGTGRSLPGSVSPGSN